MPTWAQVLIAAAAVVTAIGVLWSKVLRPGMKAASAAEEMLPLLRDLTRVFRGTPGVFEVLDQIVAQFRTDSGSSLRDVVNRLEVAADDSREAGETLKVGVEAARILADRDRQQLDRLIILIDRLTIRVDLISASGQRIEAANSAVADDLAAAHQRADNTIGDPGAAADAASQTGGREGAL